MASKKQTKTADKGDSAKEILLTKVMEALESGDSLKWTKTWTSGGRVTNFVTGQPFTGGNAFFLTLMAMVKGYDSPFFCTFKQYREQLCGIDDNVRYKPSFGSGIKVLRPLMAKKEREDGTETFYCRGFGTYTVFHVSEFADDGVHHPKAAERMAELVQVHENKPVPSLDEVLANWQDAPTITGGVNPVYFPSSDTVQCPPIERFFNSAEYALNMLHECAHATGHPNRLGRFDVTSVSFGSKDYSFEELVAEFAAMLAMLRLDIPMDEQNSIAYLAGWGKKLRNRLNGGENVAAFVYDAMKQADAAVGCIFNESKK